MQRVWCPPGMFWLMLLDLILFFMLRYWHERAESNLHSTKCHELKFTARSCQHFNMKNRTGSSNINQNIPGGHNTLCTSDHELKKKSSPFYYTARAVLCISISLHLILFDKKGLKCERYLVKYQSHCILYC